MWAGFQNPIKHLKSDSGRENRINPYLEIHIVIKRTEERMCALKMAADE